MKVLADLGKLNDGRNVLVLQKADRIEYVLASGYDPSRPEGSQWDHGTYLYDLTSLADVVTYTNMPIGYGRLAEIASKAIDGIEDAKQYCMHEIDMDESELKFFGIIGELTLEEYDKKMSIYGERIHRKYSEELYREISSFQQEHMERFLKEYEDTIGDDPKKEVCYQLLRYAVQDSESGNAIVDVDFITNEDEAADLQDTIFEEIGHYLLDDCEVYQESNGDWVADVMFAGNYVPYWDGWRD